MILGIDPGAKGALAFLYDDDFAEVHDMPMLDKEVNGSAVAELLAEFRPDHIWLEQINSFGMGRTSAFNFGRGYGILQGVFQTLKIPYTLVTPQKWKKFYSLNKDKSASRLYATRIFPRMSDQFVRVKDDGRAEALLIAKYGRDHAG